MSFATVIGWCYRTALKPVLFRFDPEDVHDRFLALGSMLGRSRAARATMAAALSFRDPRLEQTVLGIRFANPVGLAAGFDKNGILTDILPSIGFGHAEIGSVTGEACAGNARPRLWRLPKTKSLVVWYGLKNEGAKAVAARMRGRAHAIPIGASVAKTNSGATVDPEAGIADYAKAFRAMADVGDYMTVNISCPNAFGGEPFTDPEKLDRLLAVLDLIPYAGPVFLKLSPDVQDGPLRDLVDVARKHRVQGFVCSNLCKRRELLDIKDADVPEVGGLSGMALQPLADAQLRELYALTRGSHVLIGVGGIFTAEDAYRKIRSGATLVQLITGMIFEGPQMIGEVNRGLARLLARDGFASVADAVGADVREAPNAGA
ncbi:MAG: hypothetical protein RLZZ324_380 [Candidatus Parcubacteria bacterium]|jgi:dihydroorotate dehydrogenase